MSIVPNSRPKQTREETLAILAQHGLVKPVILNLINCDRIIKQAVTSGAYSNYIKPMFHSVSQMMVVVMSWLVAVFTRQGSDFRQFSSRNCVINFITGLVLVRVIGTLLQAICLSMLLRVCFNFIRITYSTTPRNLTGFDRMSFSPSDGTFFMDVHVCSVIPPRTLQTFFWVIRYVLTAYDCVTRATARTMPVKFPFIERENVNREGLVASFA